MTPKEVLALMKKHDVKFVDVKFMDFPGTWQHFSVPASHFDEGTLEDGLGFDGSSIRGWQAINESDMLVKLDPATAIIGPFATTPTLSIIGNIFDPISLQPYSRDPRYIAQKAVAYLKSTGIADTAFFGPEAEFFVFDHLAFHNTPQSSFYEIDSAEGPWSSGKNDSPNLAYSTKHKEGYFPVPPSDTLQDLRSEMVLVMEACGLNVECHHHEVATAGQCEIDMRFNDMITIADHLTLYKYIVKNVARRNGKVATFMPKPMFGDNGSGMHTHQSLWKDGKPLFAGDEYAGLSKMALHYIGGLLKHAKAVLAIAAPTTNSYRRLVPGYEAPVNLAYSSRNRSAAVRIPMYSNSPKAKRIEFRPPDPTCNPYLAFSAMLMAGLDGIQNKIDPGSPLDKNIYELSAAEKAGVPNVPGSLEEALNCLEEDHEFLLRGNVFTEDVISKWIEYKRETEVEPMKLRPHPYEFSLYHDA